MQKNFDVLGVMLDCSRNGVMNVQELKRFITILSKMGYNQLQLYIEDIYYIEGEPFFGYRRGRYTKEELREVVAFGEEHGVDLVPCIQTLAHLGIFRWKDYAPLRDCDDILLVGDEKVYELIEKMFTSLRECFKTDRIHIGMDEAHNLGKGKYLKQHGERNRIDIILEHLTTVRELASKHGFTKPMMWSDMLYKLANNGQYYLKDAVISQELKDRFPKDMSLVYWHYTGIDPEMYDSMIKTHKQISDEIIYAGGAWKWATFVPHNNISIHALTLGMKACIENDVKEALVTLWGDNGNEASVYSILPSLCTAACINIGIFDIEGIKQKFYEWTGADYDAFMLLDQPDHDPSKALNRVVNPSKYQLYNDCLLGLFDVGGVYEGDGENYAKISSQLKLAKAEGKAGDFGYVFDTVIGLCDVLELKAEIGIRARKAYKANNKSELQKIVSDYCEMIDRTEDFYNTFRKQWYKENKSFGFGEQDLRLGGLIMRMKNCCNIIEEYLAGETDAILELEEDSLQMVESKEMIYTWRECIS